MKALEKLTLGWPARDDGRIARLSAPQSPVAVVEPQLPFAFLGPPYDTELKSAYTEISGEDI